MGTDLFASKRFITVVGGASKLFAAFNQRYLPGSVVSYADRRYSDGGLYKVLGFEFSHNAAPNYWYFKNRDSGSIYSRIAFQKHKLAGKLPNFDPTLSEWENMKRNGYDRVFDCGNSVWNWVTPKFNR
jgi:hypothetical protein